MANRYLTATMRRNTRKVMRRSLRTARTGAGRRGSSRGSSGRGGTSQGLLWWLAIVVAVILLAGVVSWFQGAGQDDASDGPSDEAETGTVVRVVDGDTLVVDVDGEEERVRLLNIDTPESVHPTEPVECLGPEASEHMESLVSPGDPVMLEFDEERLDRYDRLLAGVWSQDVLLNVQMARDGFGAPVYFAPNDRFLDAVEEAWSMAEAEGVGVFAEDLECEPSLP